jgi:hypothetical protein
MILHVLIAMVAGWLQRHQQQVMTYLLVENRILKAQLGGRRLRLTDTQRHHLAALAHPLGRQRLKEIATIATPDTLLRWYKRLIAQKFDGSKQRHPLGRPRVPEEIEQLVVRMADENATWGYRRIQGALANLAQQEGTSDRRQEQGNVCRFTFLHWHFACVHARWRHFYGINLADVSFRSACLTSLHSLQSILGEELPTGPVRPFQRAL